MLLLAALDQRREARHGVGPRLAVAPRSVLGGVEHATRPQRHIAQLSSSATSSSGSPGESARSAIVTGRARRSGGSRATACSWPLSTR